MSTDDLLDCPICSEKFTNAHETSCCHHCFCKACAEEWINKTKTCPSCRKEISSNDLSASVPIQRLVDILPVECPNAAKGCDARRLTRGVIKEHLEKSCGFAEVQCTLGCGQALLRKDMTAHQKDECPLRLQACEKCAEMVKFNGMEEHIKDTCKKTEVHCPNNCGNDVERELLARHLKDECHAMQLTCPYNKFGCTFTGSRAEYNKHLIEDTEEHVKMIDDLTMKRALETSSKDSEITALEKELMLTKQCLEQFLVLKPSVPYHPMDKQPVMLPTYFKTPQNSKLELSMVNDTITAKKPISFPFNMRQQPPVKEHTTLAANVAIPITYPHVYYFEVQIIDLDASGMVSIGLAPADRPLEGLPGWKNGSFGIHSDDGRVYYEDFQSGIMCTTPFGKGCTVGCGWDMRSKELFFTVNGMSLGFQFRNIPLRPLFPVIGFLFSASGKAVVRPNFGTNPFVLQDPTRYQMPTTAGVKEMLIKHNCTYHRTARNFSPQFWVQCFTCTLNGNTGICITCANICHKGHQLGVLQYGDFFCDCFESSHCTLRNVIPSNK
jgi:hypothetical protein